MADIYEKAFVQSLFNEMASTYGLTNLISSFGFCERWRRQCVALAQIKPGMTVCDMMTGMGECWPGINNNLKNNGKIISLDFSSDMCRRAMKSKRKYPNLAIEILEQDALSNDIPSSSADCLISSFGLKTLSDMQKDSFVQEIKRILKPNGVFSLVEISVPETGFLKTPYMFYLKHIIPFVGLFLLGNPKNYRFLGIYTERFKNSRSVFDSLKRMGFQASFKSLFFGCATAVWGRKPPLRD